jgi:phosphoglycolate phosphatase
LRDHKLIIFDWDGTLFRSIDLIQNSIVTAGDAVGVKIEPALARHIIGLGLKAAQKELFPDWATRDAEFFTAFHKAYRTHFEAGEADIPLYDGVFELMRDLHKQGRTLAVATAKSRAGIDRSLKATGLAAFVSHSRTPEECRPKPDPQMIHEIIAEANLALSDAIMIGDTTHDLKMAKNAGVAAIGLTHGAHSEELLRAVNPLAVYGDIHELRQTLI